MLVEGRSAFVNIYDFKDGEGALQVLNTDPGPLQCAALFRSRHTQLYPPALSFLGYPGRLHGLICGLSVAEVCSACCPSFPLEAGELVLIYAGEKPYTLYTEEDLQKFPVIRVEPEYEIPYLFLIAISAVDWMAQRSKGIACWSRCFPPYAPTRARR